MGAAAAGETPDDTNNVTMNSINDAPIGVSEDAGGAEQLLGASGDGTFTDLDNLIFSFPENSTIKLEKNYTFDLHIDYELSNGLMIDNNGLTIDGQGKTIIDAGNYAKIFTIYGENIILKGITFTNTHPDKGSAITWNGFNGTVIECNFENNVINNGRGAAINWVGANGTVTNSIFKSNGVKEINVGGAIVWDGVNGTVTGSQFVENTAYLGSAIYWSGVNGTVTGTRFVRNTAESSYGLFESKRGNIIKNTGNTIDGDVVNNELAKLFLDNTQDEITLQKDYSGTGRVYINQHNLVINGNNQVINGIGLIINTDNVTIKNININNVTDDDYVCHAIQFVGSNGTVKNSNFTNNSNPKSSGGAIHARDGCKNLTVINCVFKENYAGSNYGGAIDFQNSQSSNILDSVFIGNAAIYGGAIMMSAGFVNNCTFINNTANDGGALLVQNNYEAIINNSKFIHNGYANNLRGKNTNTLLLITNKAEVNNCTFDNNYAYPEIIQTRGDSQTCKIINSTFKNHNGTGYIVNLRGRNSYVFNCTFEDNIIQKVVYVNVEGAAIINSTFDNNTVSDVVIYSNKAITLENNTGLDIGADVNATVLGNRDYYISSSGTGNGTNNPEDYANWTYAYDNIARGKTIYLTSGIYYFNNTDIVKSVNIVALTDDVFVDLNGESRAFTITADDVLLKRINFINGANVYLNGTDMYPDNSASVLYWAGTYGSLKDSSFRDNNGTAILWSGRAGSIDNCIFTDNNGTNFNDIIRLKDLVLTNNKFTGNYINSPDILLNSSEIMIKATSDNEDITVNILIDNEMVDSFNISANSTGVNKYKIHDLTPGEHELNVTFTVSGSNTYTNNVVKKFNYTNEYIIYVSPDGNGNGSIDNPTNITEALSRNIESSTIKLLPGEYIFYNIPVAVNNLKIIGSPDTNVTGTWGTLCLNVMGNNVSLINITFKDAYSLGGSAITWGGSQGKLTNCTFINCGAVNDAGAIYWTGSQGIVDNCTFINSSASNGGAIYWTGSQGIVKNSTFENNSASLGSAIYWSGSCGSVVNSTFKNNTGTTKAIYKVTSLHDINNTYDDNYDEYYIDILTIIDFVDYISLEKDYVTVPWTINNNNFVIEGNNHKLYQGYGRVFTIDGANVTVKNIDFVGNNIPVNGSAGAAISWRGENGNLLNSNFTNFYSNFEGRSGSIYWSGDYGNIFNITVINATTLQFGAAIATSAMHCNITNSTFINSTIINPKWSLTGWNGAIILYPTNSGTYYVEYNTLLGTNNRIVGGGERISKINNNWFGTNSPSGGSLGEYLRLAGNISSDVLNVYFTNSAGERVDYIRPITYTISDSELVSLESYINFTGESVHLIGTTLNPTIKVKVDNQEISIVNKTDIIYVSLDGKSLGLDYDNPTNWTYALNNVLAGQTIKLLPGVYTEIFNQIIPGDITISGYEGSIIDGNNLQKDYLFQSNGNINIENLNISNISVNEYVIKSNNVYIYNTTFSNINTNNNLLQGYTVFNNSAVINYASKNTNETLTGGSVFEDAANLLIENSTFINCTSDKGTSIAFRNAYSQPFKSIRYSTFINCTSKQSIGLSSVSRGAISFQNLGGNTIENSVAYNTFINSIFNLPGGTASKQAKMFLYNWFGSNDYECKDNYGKVPVEASKLRVNIDVKYEYLIDGEENHVLDVYFIDLDDNRVDVDINRPVLIKTNTGENFTIKNNYTNKVGIISTHDQPKNINISLKVDNQELGLFTFNAYNDSSLSALNMLITKGAGKVIYLNKNYTYNESQDKDFYGIIVDKSITIIGNNVTIDGGNNVETIFNITSNDVVLDNIAIKNVTSIPIISSGNNINIYNVLTDNIEGVIVNVTGDNAVIMNVTANGGAGVIVNVTGDNASVLNIIGREDNNILVTGNGNDDSLNVVIENVSYGSPFNVNVTASVDGNYILTINGSEYTLTVRNGKGNLVIDKIFDADEYVATVKSSMDTYIVDKDIDFTVYGVSIDELIVIVADVDYPTNATAVVKASMDGAYIVTVNNKDYNVTVTNGIASVVLDSLSVGSYPVSVRSNIANYAGVNTTSFSVNKGNISLSVFANPVTWLENATVNVTAVDGNYILFVNGIYYNVVVSDGNGSVVLSQLPPGTYDVTISGNIENYNPVNNITSLEVQKINTDLSSINMPIMKMKNIQKILLNTCLFFYFKIN